MSLSFSNPLKLSYIKTAILAILSCATISQAAAKTNYLFIDGKSDYSIVLADNASTTEKTAARELQQYIKEIGEVTLPIIVRSKMSEGKSIYIGWTEETGCGRPDDADEGYTYITIGDNLYIYGGRDRGTMYGAFAFLEQQMGVRWYTSTCTIIPKREEFILKKLNHSERPAIQYRLDFSYQALRDGTWRAHNLLNTNHTLSKGKYGHFSACWGIHTFEKLIPPSDYFENHPDFFGIHKGKRSNNTQLCLSNECMFIELVKNLKKVIREKPGYWCYDVSQNDNRFPCECSECETLVKKYGGQSGALLWFVNKVAAEIKKSNPDIYLSTLAYHYTRQAPTSSIKPADNVVIRLCDIECCMAHPLNKCAQNKDFLRDMYNWKRITKNIYIWDYTTGFRHYLMPFPNFDVLARNYQYFCRSNVIGILEEGAHNAPWSEFSELKQWLIAKLLWNPRQDTDSLATLFINDYYGDAAPYVLKYYDLCKRQVTEKTHFTPSIEWDTKLYRDRFISKAASYLKKAIATSSDEEMLKRTNRLVAQVYYLQLRRQTPRSFTNGTAQKLLDIIHEDSTIVRESNGDIDRLVYDLGYY